MGFLIPIALLAAVVWFSFRGRASSAGILQNGGVALGCGALGVTLLASGNGGGAVWMGLGLLAWAGYAAYRTIPFIRERLDPDGD